MWTPLPLALLGLLAQDEPPRALELLDHAALHAELAGIAAAHPNVAELVTLGISRGGRVIEGLALDGADAPGKPAILVVANLEGPDVFDGAVALDHARALAAGYGADEATTAFLDATRVYVIPRANPDGAAARFATPLFERTATGRGVDDDRDGRSGEDPPADVDGDGVIAWMRVPDPEGRFVADPTDERASVEADPLKGERGSFRLEVEGFDADGDERVAEDDERDAEVNRNFPSGFEEHAPRSGLFPSDEPEARALMEFVLGHDDVALVLCYGAPDVLVGKPKTVADDARRVKRVPPAGILQSDADLLAALGKRYAKATENAAQRGDGDEGTFQRWCYDHRGLLALSTVLWTMPEEWKEPADGEEGDDAAETSQEPQELQEPEEPKEPEEERDRERSEPSQDDPKPSLEAKRLDWIDGSGEAWRFRPWTAFDHPDLGPVEVGGVAPFALREPPAAEHAAIAERHLDFLRELGPLLARVTVAECTAVRLGDGLYRVTAVVENASLLPLRTRSARRTRTARPALLTLDAGGGTVLAGPPRVSIEDLPGGGGRSETTWLVRTDDPEDLAVEVVTTNAGTAAARAEVAR